ncbi:MAG: hypothetical protein A2X52_18810 [Candidatus Rokubacteria bacterium GWC2_70_16]|nr:MAG: hypothetical protein A2X52_18810 [Candidatus Rokubacteria bacterium GWC2_70_16]
MVPTPPSCIRATSTSSPKRVWKPPGSYTTRPVVVTAEVAMKSASSSESSSRRSTASGRESRRVPARIVPRKPTATVCAGMSSRRWRMRRTGNSPATTRRPATTRNAAAYWR